MALGSRPSYAISNHYFCGERRTIWRTKKCVQQDAYTAAVERLCQSAQSEQQSVQSQPNEPEGYQV